MATEHRSVLISVVVLMLLLQMVVSSSEHSTLDRDLKTGNQALAVSQPDKTSTHTMYSSLLKPSLKISNTQQSQHNNFKTTPLSLPTDHQNPAQNKPAETESGRIVKRSAHRDGFRMRGHVRNSSLGKRGKRNKASEMTSRIDSDDLRNNVMHRDDVYNDVIEMNLLRGLEDNGEHLKHGLDLSDEAQESERMRMLEMGLMGKRNKVIRGRVDPGMRYMGIGKK